MIVDNKCCKCNYKWKDQPGAFATYRDERGAHCPRCGSVYFKWVSYRNDLRNHQKDFLT